MQMSVFEDIAVYKFPVGINQRSTDVVKTVTHENVSQEDLGGASVHALKSGVAHLSFKTEIEAILRTKRQQFKL